MLLRMRTAAALMRTRALAHSCVRDRRAGGAVEPMRMEKIRCRSLFFRETVYADEGNRPEGWSATQLAASRLTDMERTLVVEHLRNLLIHFRMDIYYKNVTELSVFS